MSTEQSNATAPTQFLQVSNETYAYRRFGSGAGLPLFCFSTSSEHSTTGIRPSPIRSRQGEKSSCSKAPVLAVPRARCLTRLPAWRSTPWRSWTGLG